MPRYFQHRDTKLPSLFVGLPVDFMQQKIEGKQRYKDNLEYEMENMGLANINAIEEAERDVAVREYYNNTIRQQNERTEELLTNLDKNNFDSQLSEAARLIAKNKKMINDVNTPGTEAYRVNKNYLQYQKFVEDVNKDKVYGQSAKSGILKQQMRDYIGSGGFKTEDGQYRGYGDFTSIKDEDYTQNVLKIMKETTIDVKGSESDYISPNDPAWIKTWGKSTESRPYIKLYNVAKSALMSDENKERIVSEIYARAGNFDDSNERQSYIKKEFEALGRGGVTDESLSTATEGDFVSQIDENTIAGSVVAQGLKAYRVANVKTKSKMKQNFLFDPVTGVPYSKLRVYTTTPGTGVDASVNGEDLVGSVTDMSSQALQHARNYADKVRNNPGYVNTEQGKQDRNTMRKMYSTIHKNNILLDDVLTEKGLGIDQLVEKINAAEGTFGAYVAGLGETDAMSSDYISTMLRDNPLGLAKLAYIEKQNMLKVDPDFKTDKLDAIIEYGTARHDGIKDANVDVMKGVIRISGSKGTMMDTYMKLEDPHLANTTMTDLASGDQVQYNPDTDTRFYNYDALSGEITYTITRKDEDGKIIGNYVVERPQGLGGTDETIALGMYKDTQASKDEISPKLYEDQIKLAKSLQIKAVFGDQMSENMPNVRPAGSRFDFRDGNSIIEYESQGNGYYKQIYKDGTKGRTIKGLGGLEQSLFDNIYE